MKIVNVAKFRVFLVVGMVSLCMGSFTSVMAMDADNMFAMYDAYDDVSDSSMSCFPLIDRGSDSYNHSNDVSMDSGVTDKDSDSSYDSSNDISMNDDYDYANIGALTKSVNHLEGIENSLTATFYKDMDLSKDYNRRLIKRIENVRQHIEPEDSKSKRSSVLEPLANKTHFAGYNFSVDGYVHPQTKKTELYGELELYLHRNADNNVIVKHVDEVVRGLENMYGIKQITPEYYVPKDVE